MGNAGVRQLKVRTKGWWSMGISPKIPSWKSLTCGETFVHEHRDSLETSTLKGRRVDGLGRVQPLDVELDRLLQDIPAFFHLENYDGHIDPKSSDIFIQAYLLITDPMGGSMPYGDNQLAQGLEAQMKHDGFHWDNLLPGIDSSSFVYGGP